jgi:two-component system chemotaxis response regulator CheY
VRVLIAEDDKGVAGTLADMISVSNHEVVEIVDSGLEAIRAYERHKPDVVVMDYLMSGLNGATACRNILAKHPDARIILVSAALGAPELSRTRCGAAAILQKPLTIYELIQVLEQVVSSPPATDANQI